MYFALLTLRGRLAACPYAVFLSRRSTGVCRASGGANPPIDRYLFEV